MVAMAESGDDDVVVVGRHNNSACCKSAQTVRKPNNQRAILVLAGPPPLLQVSGNDAGEEELVRDGDDEELVRDGGGAEPAPAMVALLLLEGERIQATVYATNELSRWACLPLKWTFYGHRP
jgi:hypothetical protein